ncbi:hypothetical protein HYFRA_00007502 [Hymenoscyphus fraxineus]|uniref:Polyprenal reductase n=1 Tax=Hymenoscyphus fraxineus TaxID=746836 RepID=A0A9N9KR44_9HELO|nr:hypothetical protein HYFRA_00007502 [Hymenoscyphus fraxineus]
MDPSLVCKVFFALGTAVDIGGVFFPSFRKNIMNYGSRRHDPSNKVAAASNQKVDFNYFLEFVASFQVPHSWFIHYYIFSVMSSIFWAFQIYTQGPVVRFLAFSAAQKPGTAMTIQQLSIAWLLMAVQGSRRLYESIIFAKPSRAKMWFGLWIAGLGYYFFMSIAVWIEGIPTLEQPRPFESLRISWPSIRTTIAIPLFAYGSIVQHICHKHLASLKKYSLPQHPFFKSTVTPHYACECLIYLAIAIAAAPDGKFLNGTVLAGLAFVVSNLAVTADSTRKWYVENFGSKKLAGRWRMIPHIY